MVFPFISAGAGSETGWTSAGPGIWGGYSNAVNLLALGWTVVICAIMVMPPNTVAGISMAMVIALLYSFHRFTGPHEIRKPTWAADEGPITPNS